MKTYFHLLVYWIIVLCEYCVSHVKAQGVSISPGNFQEILIPSGQVVPVTVAGIPTTSGFTILHAHAVLRNITLSFTTTPTYGQSATGSSVGLLINGTGATAYVINENSLSVNVLLGLETYDKNAPIPGGCNMELPIKTAPYLPTTFTSNVLTIEYPMGSWPLNVRPATCDRAPLQYDIFIYYLPERDFTVKTGFDSIRLLSNITFIEKYGTKVVFYGLPPSKVRFANYAGTGRIVAIVLRTLTSSAAYVPTLSYGCELNSDTTPDLDCDVLGSTGSKLLSAWLVFAGLFLISLGHRYYKCQLFLFGFFISAVLFYLLSINVGSAVAGTVSVATVVGAVGGAAWVTIWAKCGLTPIGPLFLASFILGALVAGILAFTPLADFDMMKDDLVFWLVFFCLVLAIPLAILSFDKLTSILVSCLVGAYVFTAPLDHLIGSNLKYIFLNVMRRATDGEFGAAIIQPPYQTNDIILTITWALLALVGFCFQFYRERDRAPFPPVPTAPWDWPTPASSQEEEGDRRLMIREQSNNPNNPVLIHIPTESTPLLN